MRVTTTVEVWRAVRAAHGQQLVPFSTYSAPCGDELGDPSRAVMVTVYGLVGADHPLIGASTTWDAASGPARANERTEYWLCLNKD